MEKKYILTDETITINEGIVLHRIKAIRSFCDVNEGNLGGWIEKEDNLSHEGDCWVYGDAQVCDESYVYDNAKVHGNAHVYGHAKVYGNAFVFDNARIFGNAEVYGDAQVFGDAQVLADAIVYDNAKVYGNAIVFENAKVYGDTEVFGNAEVHGDAQVYGDAQVFGNVEIYGDAIIQSDNDYIVFKNWWSSRRYFTWTRSNNMWRVGCFYGTGKELIKKAYEDSEICGREYERIVKYVESILKEEEK